MTYLGSPLANVDSIVINTKWPVLIIFPLSKEIYLFLQVGHKAGLDHVKLIKEVRSSDITSLYITKNRFLVVKQGFRTKLVIYDLFSYNPSFSRNSGIARYFRSLEQVES